MTNKILYWVTAVFAGLALLLLIFNACMINSNQRIQADIASKQQLINTAMTVSPINQQLSQALYDASMKSNDEKIKDLLVQQGFKLPAKTEAKDAADPKKAPAPAKKKASEE